MRYALISDIHANLHALDSVLADIDRRGGIDAIYHLGDLVGYSAFPNEVLARLRSRAIGGSMALRWLLGPVANFGATLPALDLPRSFAIEAGYSAILALVIFGVATDERVPRSVPPFAIGAAVFAGALVTGPLTGGSFNPARSLGPAVAGGLWQSHSLYWAAPNLGMLVAARLHGFLHGGGALEKRPWDEAGTARLGH